MLTKQELAQAACAGKDLEIFFSDGAYNSLDSGTRYAKAICASCPVQKQCLADALENDMQYGVWGGTTPAERKAIVLNMSK